jgi:iron complex outermembrane receptor protein
LVCTGRACHIGAGILLVGLPACFLGDIATADSQSARDGPLDEVIVVGSRRQANSAISSPVPVDNLEGNLFRNIGTSDLDDVLRTLVPAYNVLRYPLDDESSLVRPATLRGLPPENTLILINGKRLHRSAVLAGVLGGSQGPDTSIIAPSAIGRVEVLRDGASAQYGSDAIAGVINFVTRTEAGKFTVEYKLGEFYEGDGRTERLALTGGFRLGERGTGFAALEYGNTDQSVRAVQRFDARALEGLGAEGIPTPAQSWGQPRIDDDLRFFLSLDHEVGENGRAYGFAHYASRTPDIEFFWRNPNGQFGVYTFGPNRLVLDLTPDQSANCPSFNTPDALPAPDFFFPTEEQYAADRAALAQLASDPDCWTVNEMYPAGYRPQFGAEISDWGSSIGFQDRFASGLRFDASLTAGESRVEYVMSNSLNPSLGPRSPTAFRPGGTEQLEISVNVDMAMPFDVDAFYSPLHVAWGFEWREERFTTLVGDPASYEVGPLQVQGASIGSHGYPGYSPENAGDWSRANWAAYVDLEADLTERFLLAVAGRYEEFEDFGSTTNGKLAARVQATDSLALRASVSTGFRAPTPGQSNFTRLITELFDNELRQVGLIPPTNPVAAFYGGKALEPEKADNVSAGIVFTPLDNLSITFDYFRIDVEDRIETGPEFEITETDRQELIAQGVPGASDFGFIRFFSNAFDLRSEGWDLVVDYQHEWPKAGDTLVTLAVNETTTTPSTSGNIDGGFRQLIVTLENQPRHRGILTLQHQWNDIRLLGRLSYYDGYVAADTRDAPPVPVCTDERPNPDGTDECYSSKWVFDIEAAYTFADHYTLVLGAENLFDTYPDKSYDYPDFSFGQVYNTAAPFGYNGGFWYVRLRADF